MNIGIDMDEVLAEFLDSVIEFHNYEFKTNYTKQDFFSYNYWEVWGGTYEEMLNKMELFYRSDYYKNIRPVNGSKEALIKLKSNGHKLFVITSRQIKFERETVSWLNKYFPEVFTSILFGNHFSTSGKPIPKSLLCKKVGVDLMIDDSLEYIKDCSDSGIISILFDKPWNRSHSMDGVKRIYSWQDKLY